MFKNSMQVVNEVFEHDKVKIHLLKLVSENLQTPEGSARVPASS